MNRRDLLAVVDEWGPGPIAIGAVLYFYHFLHGDPWRGVFTLGVYTVTLSFLIFHRDRLHRDAETDADSRTDG